MKDREGGRRPSLREAGREGLAVTQRLTPSLPYPVTVCGIAGERCRWWEGTVIG